MVVELRYHVPRSQVWAGSGGRQRGAVHLHVMEPFQSGRLRRERHDALCGRDGWYERPPDPTDTHRCPRCVELAARHGVRWPDE